MTLHDQLEQERFEATEILQHDLQIEQKSLYSAMLNHIMMERHIDVIAHVHPLLAIKYIRELVKEFPRESFWRSYRESR